MRSSVVVGVFLLASHTLAASSNDSSSHCDSSHSSDSHGDAHLDTSSSIGIISVLIILLLVVNFGIDRAVYVIDSCLQTHEHAGAVAQQIKSEVFSLGLASLAIVAVEASALSVQGIESVSGNNISDMRHLFEIVHLGLFVAMLLYVLLCILLFLFAKRAAARFRAYEETVRSTPVDLAAERAVAVTAAGCCCCTTLFKPFTLRAIEYETIRATFISQHNLPRNFDFACYLKECLFGLLVELCDVHPFTYAVVVVGVALNWIRYEYVYSYAGEHAYFALLPLAVLLLVAEVVLWVKTVWVHSKIVSMDLQQLNEPGKSARNVTQKSSTRVAPVDASDYVVAEEPMSGCLCCTHRDTTFERLWWCSRPFVVERLAQLLLLLTAWFVGLVLYYSAVIPWWSTIACLGVSFVSLILVFPRLLSVYVVAANVGLAFKEEVLEKMEIASESDTQP